MSNIQHLDENNKYRGVSKVDCLARLKEDTPIFLEAYEDAQTLYKEEVRQTPIMARPKPFEANLFNAKLNQSMLRKLPENCKKIGDRFCVYKNGFLIFLKKLDDAHMPMNILTKATRDILHQEWSLFGNEIETVPILFFGYQKSNGIFGRPEIVYINNGIVQWSINAEEMGDFSAPSITFDESVGEGQKVRLKLKQQRKAE